ncbi:DUF1800 domain-containing protein [Paludibacterium yongneupense]|uniref:DUF1800 domain-containing protein n=1 Tax=Paludibacterium yongneupense TaxID=400061 RepID=UPI00041EBC8B|nr:DUF1800 domain-containing protein [Paludibacterium yongneupense]
MPEVRPSTLLILLATALCACATPPRPLPAADTFAFANRLSWGANSASLRQLETEGADAYLGHQLRPSPDAELPPAVQSQVAALEISRKPMTVLASELEEQRKTADAMGDEGQKKAAQQAYQQHMNQLARETATRSLLRDLYSPQQLQEQMTWFWLNHFSVHQYKGPLRFMLADYEDRIRSHALGRFRDLLELSSHHPAMLVYLDNNQNALGHLNENYARELMELHTLGVNGGYSQHDVQELARILTGLGVNLAGQPPHLKRDWQSQYWSRNLVEFNPARHDYGDKIFLGHPIRGRGSDELEEVLDRLARHPATARFLSRKLALYFTGNAPSPVLLDRLAQRYLSSDGQIGAVLQTLFESAEFRASLGKDFKDPVHYVVSAVRLAYDGKTILNADPMLGWLNRMGEAFYGHTTPEGYPLTASGWASPGQMNTRIEIAKTIGSGNAGLFRSAGPAPVERAAFPQLSNALYYRYWQASLGPATRAALEQAQTPQEWNTFLLASPEFMYR